MVGVASDVTLCNRYPNQEKEHIFACKGRPFGCLTSPHIPTPSSTLMDYSLVKDLGLKMQDLQYQKFSFCGKKLRILGKVSISVQTIHDGFAAGSFHIKANVILGLSEVVDCECVAGNKLSSRLENISSSSDSDDDSSPSTLRSSKASSMASPSAKTPSKASPSAKSPPIAIPSANARPSSTPSTKARPSAISSPPGFPPQPRYVRPGIFKQRPPEISVSLTTIPDPNPTILIANVYALSTTFNDADLRPTSNQEVRALLDKDPGGRVEPGVDNVTRFRTSGGLVYEFGHSRGRCIPDKCMLKTQDQMPNNCGFHNQWYRPYNFQICGPSCSGSLCSCLEFY